jgi:hypothetical protein
MRGVGLVLGSTLGCWASLKLNHRTYQQYLRQEPLRANTSQFLSVTQKVIWCKARFCQRWEAVLLWQLRWLAMHYAAA